MLDYHAIRSACGCISSDVNVGSVLSIVRTDDAVRCSQNLISPPTLKRSYVILCAYVTKFYSDKPHPYFHIPPSQK